MQRVIMMGCLFLAMAATAADKGITQSAQLMQTCRTEPAACDLLIQTNLDNIRFFARVEEPEVINAFFSIDQSSCLTELTALEVRLELQDMYGSLEHAQLGASQMIFNSVAAAAINRCRGEAI